MENKKLIILLVAVVVVLAAIFGVMMLQSANAKEPTKVKITSDKSQYEGGKLSVQLTDLNKTPISKENLNVTITDKKGKVVVNETVKTNSKGNAKLDLDLKKGKYTVNVTYGGNENYTGNNDTQKLTIKEEVKQAVVQQSTQSSSSNNLHYDSEINVYYDDNGKIVDPDGKHPQGVGDSYSEVRDLRDRWERGEDIF